MDWRCDNCGGTRAIYDTAWSEPRLLGCLDCDGSGYLDWGSLVSDDQDGEITACVAPLTGGWGVPSYSKRCGKQARIGALCYKHAEVDSQSFWECVVRYLRWRGPKGLPDAYRRVFRWALDDAGLAINDASVESKALTRAGQWRKHSVVYFVEREGLIKIGTTTNLRSRLNSIGKGSSMPPGMTVGPVTLLAAIRGTRVEESEYHQKFRRQRVAKTEWFRPNKALWREIETIQRTHSDMFAELASA